MNLNNEMVANGVIREDTISGRGWYIVIEKGGVYYLHNDGIVRMGVGEDTDKPAFWPSFQAANLFFSFWKVGVVTDHNVRADKEDQ